MLFALSIALAGQTPNFERIELAEPFLGTQPLQRASLPCPSWLSDTSIVLTDWNRDGKLDLAFTGLDGSGVLLCNGDGGFQQYGKGVLDLPETWGQSVTAADIDGDDGPTLRSGRAAVVHKSWFSSEAAMEAFGRKRGLIPGRSAAG